MSRYGLFAFLLIAISVGMGTVEPEEAKK